jgi:hypothetical protein
VLKRRWLVDELGEDQWQLQRQITRVFDPLGILNPGKVFTDWWDRSDGRRVDLRARSGLPARAEHHGEDPSASGTVRITSDPSANSHRRPCGS